MIHYIISLARVMIFSIKMLTFDKVDFDFTVCILKEKVFFFCIKAIVITALAIKWFYIGFFNLSNSV